MKNLVALGPEINRDQREVSRVEGQLQRSGGSSGDTQELGERDILVGGIEDKENAGADELDFNRGA